MLHIVVLNTNTVCTHMLSHNADVFMIDRPDTPHFISALTTIYIQPPTICERPHPVSARIPVAIELRSLTFEVSIDLTSTTQNRSFVDTPCSPSSSARAHGASMNVL